MDQKREELKDELTKVGEELVAVRAELGALTAAHNQTQATLEALAKDANEFEEAGAKIVDRLEAVESVLSTPRGRSDEGVAAGSANGTTGRKAVFGNLVLPGEYHR